MSNKNFFFIMNVAICGLQTQAAIIETFEPIKSSAEQLPTGPKKPVVAPAKKKAKPFSTAAAIPAAPKKSVKKPTKKSPNAVKEAVSFATDGDIEKYLAKTFVDGALQDKKISLRSRAKNIQDVVELIGVTADIDFVIDDEVKGTVGRVHFVQRTPGDILQLLCAKNNPRLALIKQQKLWRIMLYKEAMALLKRQHTTPLIQKTIALKQTRCDDELVAKIEEMWRCVTQRGKHESAYCSIDKESKKVFLRCWPSQATEMAEFVAAIDFPTPQVRIDAVVATVDNTFEQQLGFNWSIQGGDGSGLKFQGQKQATALVAPMIFSGSSLTMHNLMVELRAAQAASKAKILLNPSVLTNHGEVAEIIIGSSVPIKTMVEEMAHGKLRNVQSINYQEVGTILNVKPHISPDRSRVQLDILVENSSVIDHEANDHAPTIKKIRTKNKVTLRSGQTTTIGGLMLNKDEKGSNEIPVLSRIPIFGALFRSRELKKEESQLLIFITPTIV